MANDTQNLMNILKSLNPQQLRGLEGALKRARTSGMDVFEKARKAAVDGYFAAIKVFHDTNINPDYSYEFQEYPKILYCMEETQNGVETIWMQFEGADETEGLGPEWCDNPGLAKKYYQSLSQTEDPQPEHKRRGRPPLNRTGEIAHA